MMARVWLRTLIVAAMLACAGGGAAAGEAGEPLGGWPRFSELFAGDARGCTWTTGPNGATCVVVSDEAVDPPLTLVRYRDGRVTASEVSVEPSAGRLGSGRVFTIDGRSFLALSHWGETSAIRFYPLDEVFGRRSGTLPHAGSVEIPRLLREGDWRIVERDGEVELIVASGSAITARSLRVSGGRVHAGLSVALVATDRTVALPVSAAADGVEALAWLEFARNGVTWLGMAILSDGAGRDATRLLDPVRLGFTTPFDQVASAGLPFLGRGATWESRRSLAATVHGGEILVATSAVVRRRTQLSEFVVQPLLVRADVDTATARLEPLDEERPGAVLGSFSFVPADHPVVSWLTESRGGDLGDAMVSARVLSAAGGQGAFELVETPRRIYAPHLIADEPLRAVWLQRDEERQALQAGTQASGYSVALAAGVVWHGSVAESVSAGLIGLALTPLAVAYWSFVGNALLVATIAVASLVAFRLAPAASRRAPGLTAGLAVIVGTMLAGDPLVAIAGPSPTLAGRLVVAALLAIVIAVRGPTADRVARSADIARWGFIATLLTVASAAYPAVMRLLA